MITKDTKNVPIDESDIIDIEIKETRKKKFRLDRDNSRIIELNTSDLNIVKRLEEAYPKLMDFVGNAQKEIKEAEDDTAGDVAMEQLPIIDKKMRDLIDWVFDSPVADKAAPDGTMYDLFNGNFRFEYVIDKLLNLYDANFKKEYDAFKKNISKHTNKYTKKRK